MKNSPAVFNKALSEVLRGLTWKHTLTYVDDILIYSKNFTSHLTHLKQVFDRLKSAGLKLKPSKCNFAAKQVTYLGHIFSKNGISVDPAKTKVVKDFPVPRNQTQVRAYLGLCNYYKKYVKNFSEIASPLNNLLKKDVPFEWTPKCQVAFDTLKERLISPPVLSYPHFDRKFILYCDASNFSISYILGQKDENNREYVIAYGGRALSDTEKRYPITHLEGLALVEGIKNFHVYLSHKPFVVYTDHAAFKWIKTNKNITGRLARWSILLQSYDFEVIHKPGKLNTNADALSRREYDNSSPPSHTLDSGIHDLTSEIYAMHSSTTHTHSDIPHENKTMHVHSTTHVDNTRVTASTQPPSPSVTAAINTHTDSCNLDPVRPAHSGCIHSLQQAELDYISLAPVDLLNEISNTGTLDIKTMQHSDSDLQIIIDYLQSQTLPNDSKLARKIVIESSDYILDSDILYHLYYPRGKGHRADRLLKQLVIPASLRNDILEAYHDALTGGHQGVERTYQTIRQKYFWTTMYKDIQFYVKSCIPCQMSKRPIHKNKAPLTPLPAEDLHHRWHMDFLGPLKTTKDGFKYILLLVESFSRWPIAVATKTMEASEVAKVLYREVICVFGTPHSIVTDRGSNFLSKVMTELYKSFGITKLSCNSFHPQTNSACERLNSFILQTLRSYCDKNQSNWDEILPSVMLAYRSTPATQSTMYSPYFIMFGREIEMPIDVALSQTPGQRTVQSHIENILQNHEIYREIAKENIKQAQGKYKKYHDRGAKEPTYKIGQRVWVYDPTKKPGLSPKLCQKWTGPFYICKVLRNYTYIVRRCSDNKQLKSPVNIQRLKTYTDPNERPTNPPPAFARNPSDSDTEAAERQSHTQQDGSETHTR